jgi:CRISPR-associated protein Csb2
MLVLELSFPGRRYHATPWDHHVNEGVVEWPPSPFRLLRALVATWYLKRQDTITRARMASICEQLTSCAPRYAVPTSLSSHTRHYMPLYDEKTAKIFDTFVQPVSNDPLRVIWTDVALADAEFTDLERLVESLCYLGRAESWVEATVHQQATVEPNVVLRSDVSSDDSDIIRLLAPLATDDLHLWRAGALDQRVARALEDKRRKAKDPAKAKLSPKDRARLEAELPTTLLEVLEVDTGVARKEGWSRPPGTRWLEYARPRSLLRPARTPRRAPRNSLPTVARFEVSSSVAPRLTSALHFAERARKALISRSDGAAVFTGRRSGDQRFEGHEHAHIFCESHDREGRITHMTAYAPMGFDDAARTALEGLTWLPGAGGHHRQLVLLALGVPEDFVSRQGHPLFGPARIWESVTPFVATRHPKRIGGGETKRDAAGLVVGSPEQDLRRLLSTPTARHPEGLPSPVSVEALQDARWRTFKTRRATGDGRRAQAPPTAFRLVFEAPVAGPIALGYGAHYSLGLFRASRASIR